MGSSLASLCRPGGFEIGLAAAAQGIGIIGGEYDCVELADSM